MIKVTLQQRSEAIARRLADGYRLPPANVLMSDGSRRSEDKRMLLRQIQDMATSQGRAALFTAKF